MKNKTEYKNGVICFLLYINGFLKIECCQKNKKNQQKGNLVEFYIKLTIYCCNIYFGLIVLA